MKYELSHVRHDPAHCLAPGLFRSLKRGERTKHKLDVRYQYGDDEQVRFIGFEPLCADDLRLMQGLVALAGPNGILLTSVPKCDKNQQLRLLLDPQLEATQQDGLVVHASVSKLLTEIGLTDGGDNIKNVKASLIRMSNVTVVLMKGHGQASFHLMSHTFDQINKTLFVALNPRIAEAVLGQRPYTRIEMAEVRALKSDAARLIHQRLCGWIDPGKAGNARLETLCDYVWPSDTSNVSALKKRRTTARKSLAELEVIGWTLSEYAKGKWTIHRPKERP